MGILGNLTGSELSDKYVSEEQKSKNEGLLEMLKNMPEDTWDRLHWLDKAALMSSPIPVIGTGVGLAADIRSAVQEPEEFFTPANLALTGFGYFPFARAAKYGDQLGIIKSSDAKNLSKSETQGLLDAEKLIKEGADRSTLFKESGGWELTPEGDLIRHQSDYGAKLNFDDIDPQELFDNGSVVSRLEDVYDNPNLYSAYPSMRNTMVEFSTTPSESGAIASYIPGFNMVALNDIGIADFVDPTVLKQNIDHELVHGVADIDPKIQQGGSSAGLIKDNPDMDMPQAREWVKIKNNIENKLETLLKNDTNLVAKINDLNKKYDAKLTKQFNKIKSQKLGTVRENHLKQSYVEMINRQKLDEISEISPEYASIQRDLNALDEYKPDRLKMTGSHMYEGLYGENLANVNEQLSNVDVDKLGPSPMYEKFRVPIENQVYFGKDGKLKYVGDQRKQFPSLFDML